jgi:hypothetical protein
MYRRSAHLVVSTTPEGLIQIEQPIGIDEDERVHLRSEDVDQLCRLLRLAKASLASPSLQLVDAGRPAARDSDG